MDDQPPRPWFTVYPRSEPLSGRYCLGDDQFGEFSSWLELVALVERAWRAEAASGGRSPEDGPVQPDR